MSSQGATCDSVLDFRLDEFKCEFPNVAGLGQSKARA